jgi:hypothetical protein
MHLWKSDPQNRIPSSAAALHTCRGTLLTAPAAARAAAQALVTSPKSDPIHTADSACCRAGRAQALVMRAVLAQAARRQAGALGAWRGWLVARRARQRLLAKAAGRAPPRLGSAACLSWYSQPCSAIEILLFVRERCQAHAERLRTRVC